MNIANLINSNLSQNYLKVGFRTLAKHKRTTFINITSLVIGLASSILIGLFVIDETAYDQHFTCKDRLYRLTSNYTGEGYRYTSAQTTSEIAPALLQELPEVQAATRLLPVAEGFIFLNEKGFKEDIIYVDSLFSQVFDLTLLAGNESKCLTNSSSVLLSESMASKLFGPEWKRKEIIGETISVDGRIPLTITGVFKDLPEQTHFKSDLFASVPSGLGWLTSSSRVYTYVLLSEHADIDQVNENLQTLVNKSIDIEENNLTGLNLQPITDIHLFSALDDENKEHGNVKHIYALLIIAFFLIIITVINFINLYAANSLNRLKEVGIRKALGAQHLQVRTQFLLETSLITTIALSIALLFIVFFLPTFNKLTHKNLVPSSLFEENTVILIIGLTIIISFMAGVYPSAYLSVLKTAEVLKGFRKKTTEVIGVRKGLIILQFAISCITIMVSLVAYQQVGLIYHKSLGFDKENTIALANPYMLGSIENVIRFKNDLLNLSGVEGVSVTGYTPSQTRWSNQRVTFPNQDKHNKYRYPADWLIVDEGFIETMGLSLLEGRNFYNDHKNDQEAIIINKKAAEQFNLNANGESALGKTLGFQEEANNSLQNFTVIGLVSDFNFGSLHSPIKPVIMKLGYHRFEMALRLSTLQARPETIGQVELLWKNNLPNIPFEYSSIKSRFEELHKSDIATSKLSSIFCLLTILIATLGLFSMVAYAIANRTTEIGIRKVMGASKRNIVTILSKDFIKLILIACIIAIPIANYLISEWLASFAYRIELSWWLFVLPSGLLTLTALLLVSGQTLKAAHQNPVDSLRNE
uniref:ABC transporter permease n=1 Tax=Roseihalotalea indica TaxID=2867963 RepID=A0AA49JKB4_9BACT|nr:ABC transporter permease [Tunicatimonas sp. TK19036]